MAIPHQLVILQHRHPVLLVLHLFARIPTASSLRYELLDCNGVSVEILEGEVGEECNLIVLVEGDFDVRSARLDLFGAGLVRDCDVCGLDLELWLGSAAQSV